MRAYYWYKQASPGLTGLDKAKVDKKIKDLDAVAEKLALAKDKDAAEGGWFVLFRSADPRIWNTDFNQGKYAYAAPVEKAPDGVQYLKLTWVSAGKSVVIPMTNDGLTKKADDGVVGRNGERSDSWHGLHLRVYYSLVKDITKGEVCVVDVGSGEGNAGWGLGHRAALNDVQGYSWAGIPIPPTVFEIAVKAGPLGDAEAKKLLAKPK